MLALLALSGCIGGTIEAPSLAQRDYEKQPVPLPDAASEPASTLDPALAAKLKALLDQALAAHAAFTAAQAKTTAAIDRAANTAPVSETWTAAQQDLSALDTGRGPLQGIEADVDALRTDPANATPANRTAIDAAAAQVQALEDQETAAIAALGTKLKS
ncbi:hypothetical protein FHS31_002278 [Sphingomonas vulcanisoli]|uniref:Uncharacterized protein n=1 Tax=Sphingomonas vulcanisoli TaxID=1658060 RepID=A0ABX0TT43_9SPHN|nr:hypothetical protein [Sphingomonas vulcanisoli]NIJ08657.1 hypothetical protein [Sphingomonas vulcanisoli]